MVMNVMQWLAYFLIVFYWMNKFYNMRRLGWEITVCQLLFVNFMESNLCLN